MSRFGWYCLFALVGVTFLLGSFLMLAEENNKRLSQQIKSAHEQAAALEMRRQELLIELNSIASKSNLVKSATQDLGMIGYEPASIHYLEADANE